MTKQYSFSDHIYLRTLRDIRKAEDAVKKSQRHHRGQRKALIDVKALRTWLLKYELKIAEQARSQVKKAA